MEKRPVDKLKKAAPPICRYCGTQMHIPQDCSQDQRYFVQYECPYCGAASPMGNNEKEAYSLAVETSHKEAHLFQSIRELSEHPDPVYIEINLPQPPLRKLTLVEEVQAYTATGPFAIDYNYGKARITGEYGVAWRAWDAKPTPKQMSLTRFKPGRAAKDTIIPA